VSSVARQFLDRAIAAGFITNEQATELGKLRHASRGPGGEGPSLEELAVEAGYLTAAQAQRIRTEQERFEIKREFGGYRLTEQIASGAMGSVYKAHQLSLDRVVAVKILKPQLARKPEYVARFVREARNVAMLNHPNVISGIDIGEQEGLRYFVMEYAEGTTVGSLLARGGALDEVRVVRIARQIARALEHAHEAGLVHRDVKPDNILLNKDGIAKLCDLGLAKNRPETGKSVGTPAYVSPEQAKGTTDVDIRSDLYSFGCTLYHMLAGNPPFEGNARVVMVAHLSEEPMPLREVDPDISPEMEAIVSRLMEKDPDDRFASPKHLLGELESLEEERRQAAAQPTAPQRTHQRKRRRQ
jgi:serine/threonine-protein kinase